ncbi:MAG TPA: pyridoxamine 5'-phosphate oxidase [Oligoflexia bacterium]|nr:pyridoxamine 5'-phosphate oxidase [Oligoflexia bacterium]
MACALSLIKRAAVSLFHPWLWRIRPLRRSALCANPFLQFEKWFRAANRCFWLVFPEAMHLATIDEQGFPDGRFVLLKSFDERGFVFYTNSNSAKGRALKLRPHGALTFYWEALQRQVRVQGVVSPVSAEEADAYFASRPRASQIGAWASQQSEPLESRAVLERCTAEFKTKFAGRKIPRPPHWSGYRLRPEKFEFWQIRPNRLHDRFCYTKNQSDDGWKIVRLNP